MSNKVKKRVKSYTIKLNDWSKFSICNIKKPLTLKRVKIRNKKTFYKKLREEKNTVLDHMLGFELNMNAGQIQELYNHYRELKQMCIDIKKTEVEKVLKELQFGWI